MKDQNSLKFNSTNEVTTKGIDRKAVTASSNSLVSLSHSEDPSTAT